MMQSGSGSGGYRAAPKPKRSWSPVIVLLIVFGAVVISEFAVEGILGQQAAAQGEQSAQSCSFSFWIFQLGCSTSWQANPQAQAAANLAQSLELPFVLIDIVFIVAVAIVIIRTNRASDGGRGREIGGGRGVRRSPR